MVFKEAFIAKRTGKGCAVAAGRSALLALLWAGVLMMGVLAIDAPAASAQGGYPGGAPGTHPASRAAAVLLRCWPDRPVFKAGGPVNIHVAVVNTSNLPALIRARFDPAPEDLSGIGGPPLRISCYNPVTHFFPYFIGPAARPSPGPPKLTRLGPGASVGATFDLTRLYRLPPGTYHVTVFYTDLSGPSRVGKQSVTTYIAKVKSADFRIAP